MDDGPSTPGAPGPHGSADLVVNCAVCGKSLRGIGIGGECANCGTPAAASFRPLAAPKVETSAPVRDGARIRDDRPCLVCGYNLKSLEASGKCPECGSPVARSLGGALLRYSAPDYVAMLRRGVTLVEVAIGLNVILILAMFVVRIAVSLDSGLITIGPGGFRPGAPVAPVNLGIAYERVTLLVSTTMRAMGLLGWWMFSTPDQALAARDPGYTSRRLLRVFLAVSATTTAVSLVLTFIPGLRSQIIGTTASTGALTSSGMAKLVALPRLSMLLGASALSNTAFLLGFIASLTYMGHLARRLPDTRLQRRANLYRWLLPVICIAGLVICGLGPVAAFVMFVVLIDEWRRRLGSLNSAAVLSG